MRRRVLHRYASTTDDVTHSSLYTEQLLCAHALTQSFVHREAFTHRRLYTEAFAQRSFYTQKLLQTDALHKDDLALLHTNAFTDRSFYTEKPFCTEQLLHKEVFLFPFLKKANRYFPKQRGHTEGFLWQELRPGCSIEVVSLAFGIFPVNFHAKWLL